MKSVKMNRQELLDIVRKNKETHIAEYQEAVAGYLQKVVETAKKNLKLANTGDLAQIAKTERPPAQPVSFEDAYHRAIRMLELSVEDVIDVPEDTFNQLVLDEWSWKHQFSTTVGLYKS